MTKYSLVAQVHNTIKSKAVVTNVVASSHMRVLNTGNTDFSELRSAYIHCRIQDLVKK